MLVPTNNTTHYQCSSLKNIYGKSGHPPTTREVTGPPKKLSRKKGGTYPKPHFSPFQATYRNMVKLVKYGKKDLKGTYAAIEQWFVFTDKIIFCG